MSPLLVLFGPELPGADDLDERTNRPLLLVGTSGSRPLLTARVGLEEGAYLMGDESLNISDHHPRTVDPWTYHPAGLEECCQPLRLALRAS